MKYTEIKPGDRLKQYVKCYYIYESNTDVTFEDIVFPSGCMEVIFNLGTGQWQTANNSGFVTTPTIELWGQITQPLSIRSIGKNTMLGIRFFPHGAAVVSNVMNEIVQEDFFDNIENVASRYGITSRYLQKLFLHHTGLTPKLYSKINRFQNSLRLVTKNKASLTSIAYECGYFDQSHFIREFKSFTGLTPSGYAVNSSPVTLAFANS